MCPICLIGYIMVPNPQHFRFGDSIAIDPSATSRSMPSSTTWSPNDLRNPRVSIIMTQNTFLCYNANDLYIQQTALVFTVYASQITIIYLVKQDKYILHGGTKIVKWFSEKTDGGPRGTRA